MQNVPETNPVEGRVVWNPVKSLWFTGMLALSFWGFYSGPTLKAVVISAIFTITTLCLGHTLGLHRLLIHRSFACPRWLEYLLVHLGTLVGMGGPHGMIYLHEIRDWAQRHPHCHPFFIHQNPFWKDFWWQLHCEIRLSHPPIFSIEPAIERDRFYRFLQSTWMLQQVPYALLFYGLGGMSWVAAGIGTRIVVSLVGHWLIGYCAHNVGQRTWHLEGHAVQGYNLPRLGLLTMGECWHNNHHAFPDSARLGLQPSQLDPGWWVLVGLRRLGLVWNLQTPETLPERPERKLLPLHR